MDALKEFNDLVKKVVLSGLRFKLWSSTRDGNLGIRIEANNSDRSVDVAQYMTPIGMPDARGNYQTVPVALSLQYMPHRDCSYSDCSYEEGSDVELLFEHIQKFFQDGTVFEN